MPKDATLFEAAGGSPVRGYLLLKQNGSGNIPPMWIQRAFESRKKREVAVAKALRKGSVADVLKLEAWELTYDKECFYHGIRVLLELERSGKSKL
jgi:hypothetical protein